ncbi:TetR/AcrR family transcriptional regulator [Priestia megaterium]|uniref:TetR/AcrR family transcriptional regulator n=1 Tax=Priestia megaterium TaxID=1404 RepID=UPI002E22A2CD|nr:TetR/AcrR family transcriptional regulator [Priestia megaterium]
MKKREVLTSIKDEKLIVERRNQMIKGAVTLFKEKGFHRTTTREIAKAAGFSIGTLYEYIQSKEDVLYLVCDNIYDEVRVRLEEMVVDRYTIAELQQAIQHYFKVVDELQDEVLVMYQEAKSLSKDALPYVLKKELDMVEMFKVIIEGCVENNQFALTDKEISLFAHHLFVQGQMWAFRRWWLQKHYSLEEYTNMQLDFLLKNFSFQQLCEGETI